MGVLQPWRLLCCTVHREEALMGQTLTAVNPIPQGDGPSSNCRISSMKMYRLSAEHGVVLDSKADVKKWKQTKIGIARNGKYHWSVYAYVARMIFFRPGFVIRWWE
jgi:hypothetical protein